MAKKPSRRKSSDPAALLRDAAFAFAAEGRWRDLSLAEIAERAGLNVAEAYVIYPGKGAILRDQMRKIDEAVLAGTESDLGEESARDRLFDVLIRRLDAMAPYKEALAVILHDLGRDPVAGLCMLPNIRRSVAAMLEAAGLSADGVKGALRVKAVAAVFASTLRVWFRDDSEDMGKTMAALDKGLRRLDKIAGLCCRFKPDRNEVISDPA